LRESTESEVDLYNDQSREEHKLELLAVYSSSATSGRVFVNLGLFQNKYATNIKKSTGSVISSLQVLQGIE
jgi:hypothetical protein